MDYTLKMQKCQALEEEHKKILFFQRELPLCLELVTQAINKCRKELSGLSESEQVNECCGSIAVLEEFIPMKWSSSPSDENASFEPNKNDEAENNGDKKKSDWLSSVQLWNHSPDPPSKETKDVGAFQPEKKPVAAKADESHQQIKAITMTSTTSSSTTETGDKRVSESQMQRKQRRCWSPELHRRFLHALKQLGGSQVATPKQIRDLMKVDGLTNDEVKSHLQKYRLHTRRPATPTVTIGDNQRQPQFMVVEGIWAPSHDATNNRVYAPMAAQPPQYLPSGERNSRRCKSPAASSTHTPHLLPLS